MTRRPNHALRHAFRTPLLAAASALAILTASPAFADCVAGNGGPRDYLCTGTFGLGGNFTDARTVALQGAKMDGLLGISGTTGNIGFSMDAASSIINTQSFFAIQKDGFILSTSNGTIDTNTPSGTGINGSITSMFSWALVAGTTGADSNINLALGSKSTLTGKLGGLSTKVEKNSSIGLTLGGKIYSSDGYGVYAQAQDGAVNIKVDGDVITGGDGIDAVTFEFENVPAETTRICDQFAPVRPGGSVLYTSQNRKREKTYLRDAGLPVTPFIAVQNESELNSALATLGTPAVLKTADWGYDGKGQAVIRSIAEAAAAWAKLNVPQAILEAFIDYECELSVVAARGLNGEFTSYGPIGNSHSNQRNDQETGLPPSRTACSSSLKASAT